MVEVHRYAVVADRFHDADQPVALVVAHRELVADFEHTVLDFTVDHEDLFGQFDHGVRNHFAVSVGGVQAECERIAFAQSGEVRLECRQQEAGSVYELQRALGFDRFNDLTVDFQLVAQSHECFFSNFHFIFF